MKSPFSSLFPALAIDLGASRVRIATKDTILCNEPSYIAFNTQTKQVVAVGQDAWAMQDRVAQHIQVCQPFQEGEIYDIEWARKLLQIFLKKNTGLQKFLSPTFVVSVPASAHPAMHQVYSDLLFSLGAHDVVSVSAPLASSIGAGVPIADSSGSFILHLGESIVEAVVISLGSSIAVEHSQQAGSYYRKRVQHMLKKTMGLQASTAKVDALIRSLHVVVSQRGNRNLLVSGKDIKDGNPQELLVAESDFSLVFGPVVSEYERVVRSLLSRVPTILTTDVIDKGLLLSGGGAQMQGLEQYLTQKLGVAVSTVEDPEMAVTRGLMVIINNLAEFKDSLGYMSDVSVKGISYD